MTENPPTDPSAPAAPVEVEGEAVPLAEHLDLPAHWSVMEKVAYRSGWADCRLRALRALPAAPTTPDIADERVRELERDLNRLRGLIWAEVARLEGPPQAKTGEWGGKHWAEGVNVARRVGARELRAALATPSTPAGRLEREIR